MPQRLQMQGLQVGWREAQNAEELGRELYGDRLCVYFETCRSSSMLNKISILTQVSVLEYIVWLHSVVFIVSRVVHSGANH